MRMLVLVFVLLTLTGGVMLLPPIEQPVEYHDFADARAMLGIPNALNVLSNLPFLLVGAAGLWLLWRRRAAAGPEKAGWEKEDAMYAVLAAGVLLTAFGSAWYHWAPDNGRLVWDRLPMTVGFMALFAATVTERISAKWGVWLFPLLLAAGAASVFYWDWTEKQGAGDLRPYMLVQFLPLLVIPLLLALYPPKYSRGGDILFALVFYGVAKGFEAFDRPIYELTGITSGHSLKHLAAAVAVAWLIRMLALRERPL